MTASDLASGFPHGKVLRTAVLVVELGRRADLDERTLHDAYYVALFRFLGCTGFAHEEAHAYGAGNDVQTRNVMALADAAAPLGTLGAIAAGIGRGAGALPRAEAVLRLALDRDVVAEHARAQCDASIRLAELAGVGGTVRRALTHVCERFDGKGEPRRLPGEALALSARLLHVADVAEIAHHRAGEDGAVAELRRRAGKHLDPRLATAFLDHAPELFDALAGASLWQRFLDAEPAPRALCDRARADDVARVFALFADLKSVYTLGHSFGVAELAHAAALSAGLDADAARELRQAALLHDLGRVSVPNGIWDKPGKLDDAEWESVRLHAYQTERIVRRAASWAGVARVASAAHERLDASGYARAVPSALLSRPERILAAADVLQALGEDRPHRPRLTPDAAADLMAEEARSGRLDASAVEAVLAAAGLRARVERPAPPRGLSDRELEVLRLVARGKSNKEIGTLLGISARTVQNHVAHVYDKIGVYSRAGAALFVTEHGLLD